MIPRPGDVLLIRVPFPQAAGSKVRPAVVALNTGDDDLVVIPVTSQARVSEFDIPFTAWREAGLNVPSTARVHKVASIAKSAVARRLGALTAVDRDLVFEALCRTYCQKG